MNEHEPNEPRVCIQKKYDLIWQEAYKCFHEMHIPEYTKLINPFLVYDIEGLQPKMLYRMTLHFERSDNFYWVDIDGRYRPVGLADAPLMSNTVWNDLGTRSGEFWMAQGCSFIFVKLTRSMNPQPNEISLRLHHKYIPVLSIYLWSDSQRVRMPPASFRIPHTEFLATQSMSTNPRLAMLTKRTKKDFASRKQIRLNGRDKPTVYATCRIEHYLPRTSDMPKEPIWCLLNRHRRLVNSSKSGSDSSVSAEDSETPMDLAGLVPETEVDVEIKQECGILQAENVDGELSVSPVSQKNMETEQMQIKLENPSSPQADSLHQHTFVCNPYVNGVASSVPQVNMASEENHERIKIENCGSPETDSRHLSQNVAFDTHINGFISPGFPLTTEDKVKQKRIKLENPSSPRTYSRHLPNEFVGEPHVNGSASPPLEMKVTTGEKIKRAKLMNPSLSNTDFRRLPVDDIEETPGERSTNHVPKLTKDIGVKQKKNELKNTQSPQKHSRHLSYIVSYEPSINDFTSDVPKNNMETGENLRRVEFENPDSPQANSCHLPGNVASNSPVNSFTGPVYQSKMESRGHRKTIKVGNPGSSQADSRHLPNNAVGEPSVNGFASHVSQLAMDTRVKHKKTKLKTSSSSRSDFHLSHTITYQPLVNGPTLTVPQEKWNTGAKQIILQNSWGAPQPMPQTMIPPTSNFNISGTFPPVSSFLPGVFTSQQPPIQAPNFTNYPYPVMQPNLNHLAMYHHNMSVMWPNYQNLHSINSQVPLLPPANSFTLPNPLMTPHQNLVFPTNSHQNMIPNNRTPHFNNFQIPSPSPTNGFDPFNQPTQGNSAQEYNPNPERFPKQEN